MTVAEAVPKPKLTLWVFAWALVIFLMSSPFLLQLEGIDPSGPAGQQGKPYDSILEYAVTAAVGGYVWRRRAFGQVMRVIFAAPLLAVFALLGAISVLWSETQLLTIREFVAIVCVIFCMSSAIALLPRTDSVRAFLIALSACMLLSIVWALALPHYGQHGKDDLYQASHIGKWRGIYTHKNVLGQMAGLTFGVFATYGGLLVPRPLRYLTLLAAAVCIGFAQSASGMLIAGAGCAFGFAIFRLTGYWRWVSITMIGLVCLLFSGSGSEILSSILVAMGKSPTLSGRTYVWEAATQLIADHWLLGYSLSGIRTDTVAKVFTAISPEISDAHNGYLELALALGLAGLFLFLGAIGVGIARALIARLSANQTTARRSLMLFTIMWGLAAFVEAAPLVPGAPMNNLGLFVVLWLSSCTNSRSSGTSKPTSERRAQLSVTRKSDKKKGSTARPFLDLDP